MTSRAEKIDQIIASRKPIAEKTEKTIEQVRSVEGALRNVSALLQQVAQKEIPAEQKDKAKILQEETRKLLDEKIPERIRELSQLQQRFGRDSLNIGVVGNAGQGKSTLLQSLTGLQDEEIPTGGKGDCTGAAAIIENRNVPEAYADIEFYSESEFLNTVVAPYYRKLNLPQPSSLSDLAKPLPSDVKTNENFDEVKFIEERLQHGLSQYRQFLGRSSERIEKSKIREYTAKSDINGNPLSIWTAVRSAKVYCRFPGLENEKISVGDTPGLGDRSVLEAEERLMKDFGRSIDAVMMMRRINVRGVRKQDVSVFNLIKQAIPELEADKWSYFLVNVFKEDRTNSVAAEALKFLREDLRNSSLSGIQDYIEVDCLDKEAVLSEFDKILNGIAANQQALDDNLYQARFEKVKTLIAEVQTLAKELGGLFPAASGDQEGFMQAITMFNESVWLNLGAKLTDLVEEWKKQGAIDHPQFIDNLKELQQELQTIPGMPTEAEFEKGAKSLGRVVAHAFYCQAIRRNIVNSFDRMDLGFKRFFDELRDEAKKCFTAEDGGKLGKIEFSPGTNGAGYAEKKSWWASLADEIALVGKTEQSEKIANRIAAAIRQFDMASLSFRGFLLPRILPCLDVLDTNNPTHNPYRYKGGDTKDALDQIEVAAKCGIYEACSAIQGYAKEPSMSLFATIDELRDAVIRTGNVVVAGQVWSNFYAEHRSEVWSETFQRKEADIKFRKEWQNAVDALNEKIKNFV